MSGQYKVAWLYEALLVSRSGYYHWVERRRQPSPRQLENIRLRERIVVSAARSKGHYRAIFEPIDQSSSTPFVAKRP